MQTSKIALVHIPKTGGTILGHQIFAQTRSDEAFFFSFFGHDASQGANRILVERLRKGDEEYRALLQNRHFLESRVITGHFSYDLRTLLDDFSLQFAAVLREPVDRCVSTIYQYTTEADGRCHFGAFDVPSKSQDPDRYWAQIHYILGWCRGRPIPGLLPHESMMLYNGMCHLIGGTSLSTFCPAVDFARVVANLPAFKLALFERFNETCGALMQDLGLPVRLDEETNPGGVANPGNRANRRPYFGAPEELLDLVRSLNPHDVRLYHLVTKEQRFARPSTGSGVVG
jgi:hypothetical protein